MIDALNELELGKLYCDRGEFKNSLSHLESAATIFYQQKDYTNYLKASNLQLRIYAEKGQWADVNFLKEKLQDLVLKEGFELNAKTYYTLAICANYKNQNELALEYFQKSLSISLAMDNKEDICKSILGIARIYAHPSMGRIADAMKEIYNLEVFFQVYDFPEVKAATRVLNSRILKDMNKLDEALDVAWKAYEEFKSLKNVVMWAHLLTWIGEIYVAKNEKELGSIYVNLSMKSLNPEDLVELYKYNKKILEKIGQDSSINFDLLFNNENHFIVERKLGKVDFKNQFILLDLLKLFLQNPGIVYTKEYLVENVWRQPYDPAVHDNKIYVTIKRLRKLIEPDYEKPKYIFRGKNGYYMSKNAKVVFEKETEVRL